MSLIELGPVIFGGNEKIIDFLQQQNLLARRCNCTRYNNNNNNNNNNISV